MVVISLLIKLKNEQVGEQKSNTSDSDIAVNSNEKNRIFVSPLAKRIAEKIHRS